MYHNIGIVEVHGWRGKMNRKKISRFCKIVSIALVIAFAVKCAVDYAAYSPVTTSAPFSLWVEVNALQFLLLAILVFVIGRVVRKKG